MHRVISLMLWCLPGLLAVSPAAAQSLDPSIFSISGFGTVGVAHSDESRADFTSDLAKSGGAGHEHAWSPDVDSLLGLQGTAEFTPQWSAVLQVISERNYERSYQPHVEWANVKYQVNPDFSVRIGRTALPLLLVTDSRKIGYANPWVRPPPELYGLAPFTDNDGVDASYRIRFGDTTQTLQVTAGHTTTRTPASASTHFTAHVSALRALVDTLENGPLTLRLTYVGARLTIPEFAPLTDAFDQLGPQGQAVAAKYHVRKSPLATLGFSVSYDPGEWFVNAELARTNLPPLFGARSGEYVTGGYRIGRFTPYVTAARAHNEGPTSDPGVPLAGLPPAVAPTVAALDGALDTTLASKAAQTTYSIGGRWDFAKSASLKLQFDRIRLDAGSPGLLNDVQPDFVPGGRVHVFSATVDFVF